MKIPEQRNQRRVPTTKQLLVIGSPLVEAVLRDSSDEDDVVLYCGNERLLHASDFVIRYFTCWAVTTLSGGGAPSSPWPVPSVGFLLDCVRCAAYLDLRVCMTAFARMFAESDAWTLRESMDTATASDVEACLGHDVHVLSKLRLYLRFRLYIPHYTWNFSGEPGRDFPQIDEFLGEPVQVESILGTVFRDVQGLSFPLLEMTAHALNHTSFSNSHESHEPNITDALRERWERLPLYSQRRRIVEVMPPNLLRGMSEQSAMLNVIPVKRGSHLLHTIDHS